jgi:hypothetical protein
MLGGVVSAARIGVGVSMGKVSLKEKLKPGLTYKLPTMVVFNNGDVTSDYEMSLQFNERQPQLKPAAGWVSFSPQRFTIKPGKSQQVAMTIKTPSSAHPGDYFAYIEAHPLKKDTSGKAAINIAAATKFSFSVRPANFLQRIYYFLLDLWQRYKQFIIPVLLVIGLAVFLVYSRRNLNVQVKKKSKKPSVLSLRTQVADRHRLSKNNKK